MRSKKEWFWFLEGVVVGPVDDSWVRRLMEQHRILLSDFVWADGMAGWQRVADVDELGGILPKTVGHPVPQPAREKKSAPAPAPAPGSSSRALKPPLPEPEAEASVSAPFRERVEMPPFGTFSAVRIGRSGVWVTGEPTLPVGAEVKFSLDLTPVGKAPNMTGVVVDEGGKAETLIEFIRTNPAHLRLIDKYVRSKR